ncbi:MAG TPA: PIN domain-containing protein [Candidatus Acidoferrum sp.]|nr:PIN domain-containing protein [Candidatus Acidoferrum sp.]
MLHHAAWSKLGATGRRRFTLRCKFSASSSSIVTNARRVLQPRSAADALASVSSLLHFLEVLPVPAHTAPILLGLLRHHPVIGADVFDLQIVATMQANGVQRIYTFNVDDFKSFPELAVVTP